MKKFVKRVMSAILTLSVTMIGVPAVAATDSTANIPLSEPSPERIFCVVNDIESSEGIDGFLTSEPYADYGYLSSGEKIRMSDIVNEDGTLTELGKTELEIETTGDLIGMVAESLYSGILYYVEFGMVTDDFLKDYPDAEAFEEMILDKYFDGNENPDFKEIVQTMAALTILEDEEGYIYVEATDPVYASYAEYESFYCDPSLFIAPTGAYLKPSNQFSSERNVFIQLKNAWEAGEIDPYEAFTILTGYSADMQGYLRTMYPICEYYTDSEGNKLNTPTYSDCIAENGTVADTGLTPRDFAVEAILRYMDTYMSAESPTDVLTLEIITKYSEYPSDYAVLMDREYVEASIDDIIAEAKDAGVSDEDIAIQLLQYAGLTDPFGRVYKDYTTGYAADADGNKISIESIMTPDGKFLTDAYGCDNVQTLMEQFISGMSLDALLKGDATDDGKINLSDAALMLKHIAKWNVEISDDASDTNSDGKVNLSDVSTILQYIAGWEVEFVY